MEWIKTSNELPQIDKEVLVSDGNFVTVGEYAPYGQWRVLDGLGTYAETAYLNKNIITHWMPLPNKPDV